MAKKTQKTSLPGKKSRVPKRIVEPKLIIGRLDKVDLPYFGLYELPCKIDTGADTSALHCHKVKLLEKDGRDLISFYLLDPSHEHYNGRRYITEYFTERKVRSSNGHTNYRYVISSRVVIYGREYETEFTLADRENMRYPVLLGKKLLKKGFLVDVARVNLSYKHKLKQVTH